LHEAINGLIRHHKEVSVVGGRDLNSKDVRLEEISIHETNQPHIEEGKTDCDRHH
jgi:hypothetical protein